MRKAQLARPAVASAQSLGFDDGRLGDQLASVNSPISVAGDPTQPPMAVAYWAQHGVLGPAPLAARFSDKLQVPTARDTSCKAVK
jgi:hypothetical protein